MTQITLFTYDWVPELPRGYVRDLRVRWALKEAGLDYRVATVAFKNRSAEHFARQPFGQIPWLEDGELSVFESGAILLHLGEKSTALTPSVASERSKVIEWVFAALNSVEAASLPWSIYQFCGDSNDTPARKQLDAFLRARLTHMEQVLTQRQWLAADFSIADILMADVLRLVARFDALAELKACNAYLQRACARPAFEAALQEQLAQYGEPSADQPKA
ncbi:glutathione S-transferase family protein [Pseudoalteromonas sp. CNC9-20]|uniref:glutathione S-transferase family protein n=1 Tax=Pseudoalteromonas sp. CNC9-20 TaxID=2917750 RepID=UPI001EF6646A|nr:glutathione S-transferase family protein [Pseudoalteromonas sp. CNC9-20]